MRLRRLLPLALLAALPRLAGDAPNCADNRGEAPCAIGVEWIPGDRYDPVPFARAERQPRIALALSGGGAKGLAHIGVLERLESLALRPDAIAGTSIGAVVGAFYAAGQSPAEIETFFSRHDLKPLLGTLDIRRGALSEPEELRERSAQLVFRFRDGERERRPALFTSDDIDATLLRRLFAAQAISGGKFDRLRVPLRVVSSDTLNGEAFAPASGDLVRLVRASLSLPGFYEPVSYGGRVLVDGMITSNIPVPEAEQFGADLVIASDVTQPFTRDARGGGGVTLLGRALDVMLARQQRAALARAGIVLSPSTGALVRSDFHGQLPVAVEAGRAAVDEGEEALLARLDRLADSPRLAVDTLHFPTGAPADDGATLHTRLGHRPTVLRVSLEMARLLNGGPWLEARAEYDPAGRALILHLVPAPEWSSTVLVADAVERPVERWPAPYRRSDARLALGALRESAFEHGEAAFHFDDATFDPARGALTVRAGSGLLRTLDLGGYPGATGRLLAGRLALGPGQPVDVARTSERLRELRVAGVIEGAGVVLTGETGAPEQLGLLVSGRPVAGWEFRAGGSYRSILGGGGFLSAARRNPFGRGGRLELLADANRDFKRVEAVGHFPYLRAGENPLAGTLRYTVFNARQPEIERGLELGGFHDWRGRRAGAGIEWRTARAGRFTVEGGWIDAHEYSVGAAPASDWSRTRLALRWESDTRDRILVPLRGDALRVRYESSLTGRSWRQGELELGSSRPLHEKLEGTVSGRIAAGFTGGNAPFSAQFDPGGWRDAWGFSAHGLSGRNYALASASYRLALADLGPVRLYGELGGSIAWVAASSGELSEAKHRHGTGVALIAINDWIGPVTAGWQVNNQNGRDFFLLIGLPLPRD